MMRLYRSSSFMHPRQSLLHHSLQRHLCTLPHLLFLLFLFFLTSCNNGVTAQEKENRTYPMLSEIPDTSFRCRGHAAGYYADPDTGCQVYHMCDTLEKQYSYLCPNHTLFNQKFMVCDHWYMVNCSSSSEFYELNSHIGEVPDSSRGSSAEDNIISTNTLENDGRDNPLKDIKSSSVAVAFKSPLLALAKPQLPSITQISTNKDPNRPTLHQTSTNETTFTPTVTQPITTKGPNTSFSSKGTQSITTKDPETPFTATARQNITFSQETPFSPTVMEHITTNGPEKPFTPAVKQHITTKDPEIPSTPPVTQPITPKSIEVSFSSPVRQLVTAKDPEGPEMSPSFTSLPQSPSTSSQLSSNREAITKPITEPSLFLSLPNAGSPHSDSPKVPDTLSMEHGAEITEKPSNILTATHNISVSTNINNTLSSFKGGEAAFNFSIPLNQTPRPSLPFTMIPGSVARRPGSRFMFTTSNKDEKLEFSPIDIQGVVFNPFEVQSQSKTRRVLTSMPSVVTPDPRFHVATPKDQGTQSAPTESAAPENSITFPFQVSFAPHFPTNVQGNQIPSPFLQPPALDPVSINLAPFIPPSQPQSNIPINRVKQEYPTPLTTLVRNGNSQVHIFEETMPGALHIQFSSTRGNRDFFIPAAGLSLPDQDPPSVDHNSLEEDPDIQVHLHHHNNDGVHMTMVFPALLEAQMVELQLNPQCPRCHPAFLKPGECHPCVLIK
ncbi:uncharacterized protein [Panulirus ornatus]|uniref:uncharacterized protein n=1 Tax=Panulirus ornatus TaxID=150431 RepID=UPI003A8BD9CE